MASVIHPFGVRMPPELKQWLGHQAAINLRSLNSEIVKRLQESREKDEKAQHVPQ